LRLGTGAAWLGRLAAALVAFGGLAATVHAAALPDKIYQKGQQEPITDEVIDESIDGIKLAGSGGVSLRAESIAKIEYADAPAAFREAETQREQGSYDKSIRYYESALKTSRAREFWLKPTCLYYIALCQLESGAEPAKAETSFKELLDKWPKTRFLPDALLGVGRAALAARQYDTALSRFSQLGERADQRKWDEMALQAGLWKARTLVDMRRFENALSTARSVVDSSGRFREVQIQAQVIVASVYVRLYELPKAIDLLRSLIRSIGPDVAKEVESGGADTRMRRTESQCYNALASCFYKQAAKETDKAKKQDGYREALLAYLWTVVLYSGFPTEYAEALDYGSDCFKELGEGSRASELKTELGERFPDYKRSR